MLNFQQQLKDYASRINIELEAILSPNLQSFEISRPALLLEAMRYAVLNQGKRLRPILLLQTAQLMGGNQQAAMRIACAIEILHCYSLIHDDLPAMDNDDLRRGKPTLHKKYSEATAILAGDALSTLAFDIIAGPQTDLPDSVKLALILGLSRAAGLGGMTGGQALDLQYENMHTTEEQILLIHAMKTGALFTFAAKAGGIIAQSSTVALERLTSFGSAIGLAFQLADDILDLTGESQTLGKTAGKDLADGKATIASLYGIEAAHKQLCGLIEEAKELLAPFDKRASNLCALADFIKHRSY